MTAITTSTQFERLTDLRLQESKALLDLSNWDGAYYLAGYSVEFALKRRIISQLMASNTYPTKKDLENFYKHELTILLKLAKLDQELPLTPAIIPKWDIVKDWNEQSRYELGKTQAQATDLYEAIEKDVLPWIKRHW